MDSTEPPRIVLESPEICANPAQVEAVLQASLERARVPSGAWSLGVNLERLNSQEIRARAGLSNADGTVVARRVLWSAADDCEGLARAVGVWASLVLEADVARANAQADAPPPPATPDTATSAPANPPAEDAPVGTAEVTGRTDDAPPVPPMIRAAVAPEPVGEAPAQSLEPPAMELGTGMFTMLGMAGAAVSGVALDSTFAVPGGIFLRPALLGGVVSTTQAGMVAVRVDTCLRFTPLSAERSFEVEPCFGAETGTFWTDEAHVHGAIGPGLGLRYRLSDFVSTLVRGTAGANVDGFVASDGKQPFSGRFELALSWGVW